MFKEYEPISEQKIFYKRNYKRKTAGYDKYIFIEMASKMWAIYKNKRTKSKLFIRVHDNEIEKDNIFFNVVDYFLLIESDRRLFEELSPSSFKISKQYLYELKEIQEKYPEYFI